MKKHSTFKDTTLNAFTMWGSAVNGKTVFARQITGESMTSLRVDQNRVFMPIIFVGFDGEKGLDLGDLLEENRSLKKQLQEITGNENKYLSQRLFEVEKNTKVALDWIYKRNQKKWWMFWK